MNEERLFMQEADFDEMKKQLGFRHEQVIDKIKLNQKYLSLYSVPIVKILDMKESRYDEDMPECVMLHGTGFILRINNCDFLVSAKHVLEEACNKKPLYYPTEGGFEQLQFGAVVTKTNDKFTDVAVIKIKYDSLASPFKVIDFSDDLLISPADILLENKLISITGYPLFKNPISFEMVKFSEFGFIGQPCQRICNDVWANMDLNIVFGWDVNNIVYVNGEKFEMQDQPRGVSGAPIWLICDTGRLQNGITRKLIGIFTDHQNIEKLGLGSRIEIAIELLRDYCPSLPGSHIRRIKN